MKKLLLIIVFLFIISHNIFSNGVAVVDGKKGIYFIVTHSQVDVKVENQIAVVTTTQIFQNNSANDTLIKYAFPLPEGASATGLRWYLEDHWNEARMSPTPQDTTLPGPIDPGESIDPALDNYLGETPLYFEIEDTVRADSLLTIELTYVQMLDYSFGKVLFTYPNDYSPIQSENFEIQTLLFELNSLRTIAQIQLLSSHPVEQQMNDGNRAQIQCSLTNGPANDDYQVQYQLSLDELGLFSLSTLLPDSLLPDPYGGFFLFVAEPDPSDQTEVLDKVFTLIIDRSGSMGGSKIIQAKDAAKFIVENLNVGDQFNIIDFESNVYQFRTNHVDFNSTTKNEALNYIENISSNGGTNISGAFDAAIPQFGDSNEQSANIIIFFTDGQATSGITDTPGIINRVKEKVAEIGKELFIFCFGIGGSVNKQLLTLLATENKGLAEFLGNDVLEERITEFYLQIRNPLLVNTQIAFSSSSIDEVYPNPLPNLYQGQQMVVTGRYQSAAPTTVVLSGEAFGDSVGYEYQLTLADSIIEKNQFLPKIWAKQKIEYLLVQYYLLDSNSEAAKIIKQQIIEISISYGVISPFTSYYDHDLPTEIDKDIQVKNKLLPNQIELLGNYPNPFNANTIIKFKVHKSFDRIVVIRIYNLLGQLLKKLFIHITHPGFYHVHWDGTNRFGETVPSGNYIYIIDFGDGLLSSKMELIK